MDFSNKVVWITGASSGIGKALAIDFAKLNCRLVLSSRRKEELEIIKSHLIISPDKVLILPLDLEKPETIINTGKKILNHFGSIDVLINNGGISQRALVHETPMEIHRRIMEVNFFGTVEITKEALPIMQKNKSGHIVVISSIAGKFGFHYRSAYAASKHALHGFFESLRLEEEKNNIKVTLICPGKIKTDISINAITSSGNKFGKMDKSQEEGMNAEVCSHKIIEAISNNKKEIIIGGKEIIPVYLKRFWPWLFHWVIRRVEPE